MGVCSSKPFCTNVVRQMSSKRKCPFPKRLSAVGSWKTLEVVAAISKRGGWIMINPYGANNGGFVNQAI